MISASNPLDAFTYGYSDGTARVSSLTSNAGPSAALTYYGPTGDELLEQASYTAHTGSTSLQQFTYVYNSDDNVSSFSVTQPTAQTTTYGYDKANRLVFSNPLPSCAVGYQPLVTFAAGRTQMCQVVLAALELLALIRGRGCQCLDQA